MKHQTFRSGILISCVESVSLWRKTLHFLLKKREHRIYDESIAKMATIMLRMEGPRLTRWFNFSRCALASPRTAASSHLFWLRSWPIKGALALSGRFAYSVIVVLVTRESKRVASTRDAFSDGYNCYLIYEIALVAYIHISAISSRTRINKRAWWLIGISRIYTFRERYCVLYKQLETYLSSIYSILSSSISLIR